MQLVLPGVTTDAGLHAKVLSASDGRTVMLPPVEVIAISPPIVEAPMALVSEIDVPVITLGESATFTVATTPLEMRFWFNPDSKHMYDPALPEHSTVLPAAVAAGPATTLIDAMSDDE